MAYETSPIDTKAEEERITAILKAYNDKTGNSLSGTDMFEKLFLTELQNQDPSEPMDNSEMITQMAQTNMVSYLSDINKSLSSLTSSNSLTQATSMIGKAVSGLDSTNNNAAMAGIVYSLRSESGVIYLNLGNNKELKASDVLEVTDPSYLTTSTETNT